jgi:hypothetical protein
MNKIDYKKLYTETLQKCFAGAQVQTANVDSITSGLSLLTNGDTIIHLAFLTTTERKIKIATFQLSDYYMVHVNVLFDGWLPEIENKQPDIDFLETILNNRQGNRTQYYRLEA